LNFTVDFPWTQAGFEEALTFDQSLWEAVTAQTRWTRGRVALEGDDILTTRVGAVEVVDTLDPSQQTTATFHVIGPNWALPADLMWGNRAIEVFLGLAKNPRFL